MAEDPVLRTTVRQHHLAWGGGGGNCLVYSDCLIQLRRVPTWAPSWLCGKLPSGDGEGGRPTQGLDVKDFGRQTLRCCGTKEGPESTSASTATGYGFPAWPNRCPSSQHSLLPGMSLPLPTSDDVATVSGIIRGASDLLTLMQRKNDRHRQTGMNSRSSRLSLLTCLPREPQ